MEQRLIQSPQMIQAMQILQLPALDLEERIDQELSENPLLERVEILAEREAGTSEAEGGAGSDVPGDGLGEPRGEIDPGQAESMLRELERYERELAPRRVQRGDGEEDPKLAALQNTPDSPKTLAEALDEELAFVGFDERGREIAEYVANSLDERGYLALPLDEIARDCGVEHATAEEVQAVIDEMRRVLHPAIAARDLRECLLLQLEAHGFEDVLVRQLVENHIDDITTNRLPRIAKATGRSIDDVKEALEAIRTLDPHPGASYGGTSAAAILPDVIVDELDGTYEVRLHKERVPQLRLNPAYRDWLKQSGKGSSDAVWVKKRLEAARWFIDAIQQRQSTLKRIAVKIFEHQKDFLDDGVRVLHPLRMQQVADEVGVHISTVSRAVSGKYAQTPRGTFALKYFFTGGTATQDGEVESQASIKQRIAEIVAREDRSNPLSDDQLAALLAEQDKIHIARRTVTKYRKALAIPSSSQRRVF